MIAPIVAGAAVAGVALAGAAAAIFIRVKNKGRNCDDTCGFLRG